MRRHALRAAVIPFIALLAGCAVEAPPPGGEPDREVPRVALTWPADSATAVSRTNIIRVDWTEPMDRRSVERSLFVAPAIRWSRFEWERGSFTMIPAESLAAGRTYVVVLGRNARDRHGNLSGHARSFAFTTGDSMPRGVVRGKVMPLGVSDAARVFAIPAPTPPPGGVEAAPSPADSVLLSAAESDTGSTFTLPCLDPAAEVRVVAYVDRDASGSFTPEAGDWWGFAARAARPGDDRGVDVVLMDPDRQGLLWGLAMPAPDSAGTDRARVPRLVMARPVLDSLKTVVATPDSASGRFVAALAAGGYRLAVFRDMDGNGRYDSVRVAPPPPAPAPRDTAAVRDTAAAGDPTAVGDTTVVGDTTAVRDTTGVSDTMAVRDTTAVLDTTGVVPVARPDSAGAASPGTPAPPGAPAGPPPVPAPPDVIEWQPGEVNVTRGSVAAFVTLRTPAVPAPADSSAAAGGETAPAPRGP